MTIYFVVGFMLSGICPELNQKITTKPHGKEYG